MYISLFLALSKVMGESSTEIFMTIPKLCISSQHSCVKLKPSIATLLQYKNKKPSTSTCGSTHQKCTSIFVKLVARQETKSMVNNSLHNGAGPHSVFRSLQANDHWVAVKPALWKFSKACLDFKIETNNSEIVSWTYKS